MWSRETLRWHRGPQTHCCSTGHILHRAANYRSPAGCRAHLLTAGPSIDRPFVSTRACSLHTVRESPKCPQGTGSTSAASASVCLVECFCDLMTSSSSVQEIMCKQERLNGSRFPPKWVSGGEGRARRRRQALNKQAERETVRGPQQESKERKVFNANVSSPSSCDAASSPAGTSRSGSVKQVRVEERGEPSSYI